MRAASQMSWDAVAKDYILPGFERATKHRRLAQLRDYAGVIYAGSSQGICAAVFAEQKDARAIACPTTTSEPARSCVSGPVL